MQLYFAFGSNLHPRRLADRVGRVACQGRARLDDACLCFDKIGQDGSGKGNLDLAGSKESVWGAVYELTREQFEVLDEFEALGRGYERASVRVRLERRRVDAITYVAMEEYRDPQLQPYTWYQDLILAGARYHEFPTAYRERLERVDAVLDPDPERHAHWHAFARDLPIK